MKKKKINKIILGASILLLLVSLSVLINKTWSADSPIGTKYWCEYNTSCGLVEGCTCPTGTFSPTSCPAGYSSPSGSDASTDCKQNCAASTVSGYSVPALNSGSSTSVSKPPCYRTEGGQYTATATCNDGVVSITNQSALSCFTNFKYTFGSWYEGVYGCYDVCVSDVCVAGTISGYDYPQLSHYGSVGDSKTITGGSCSATIFCADGGVTVQSESCTCNAGYYLSGTSCLTCTSGYYCTGGTTSRTLCPSGMTSWSGADAQTDCFCKSSIYPPGDVCGAVSGYDIYYNCDGSIANGCEIHRSACNGSSPPSTATVCCGDSNCVSSIGETSSNCIADCGYCGDGTCSSGLGEDCSSCAGDCGACSCYNDYYNDDCPAGKTCCGGGSCSSWSTYYCYDTPTNYNQCVNVCYGYWYDSGTGVCCTDGACYDSGYGAECYYY